MKRPPIDWPRVEGAMRRCKLGTPMPGDVELCTQAYRRAPTTYGKRKQKVDEAVILEEQERWRS